MESLIPRSCHLWHEHVCSAPFPQIATGVSYGRARPYTAYYCIVYVCPFAVRLSRSLSACSNDKEWLARCLVKLRLRLRPATLSEDHRNSSSGFLKFERKPHFLLAWIPILKSFLGARVSLILCTCVMCSVFYSFSTALYPERMRRFIHVLISEQTYDPRPPRAESPLCRWTDGRTERPTRRVENIWRVPARYSFDKLLRIQARLPV